MAYTTYSEIEDDFKDITFGASTHVQAADVTQFIVEADALINAYVGTKYTVPVSTAGEGLSLLKLLSRSLVTARIKKILEVKQEKNPETNQNVVGVLLSPTKVIEILENIRGGKIALAGASALISSSGFYSNNYANDVTPVVEKDTKQW